MHLRFICFVIFFFALYPASSKAQCTNCTGTCHVVGDYPPVCCLPGMTFCGCSDFPCLGSPNTPSSAVGTCYNATDPTIQCCADVNDHYWVVCPSTQFCCGSFSCCEPYTICCDRHLLCADTPILCDSPPSHRRVMGISE